MPDGFFDTDLLDRLPEVRGKCVINAPLSEQTWFRAGGPAEVLYRPADEEDLSYFLAHCPSDIPVTVLGNASNVLVRDGGIPGVVVRFSPSFALVKIADHEVRVGAASVDLNVARAAQSAGIGGLEFLSGIPGSIGGGLRMNAGAYGKEFKDVVISVEAIERNGTRRILSPQEMGFSYRHTDAPEDMIFVGALMKGHEDDPENIQRIMMQIQRSRSDSQPIREKTGGSTFANPDNDPEKRKSWQLIDAAGCRGLKMGQAQVSDKHCNFLINTGKATARDIERLGEEVRRRVFDAFGVDLRWEIKRLGVP